MSESEAASMNLKASSVAGSVPVLLAPVLPAAADRGARTGGR